MAPLLFPYIANDQYSATDLGNIGGAFARYSADAGQGHRLWVDLDPDRAGGQPFCPSLTPPPPEPPRQLSLFED